MGNVRPTSNRDVQDPLLKYGTRRRTKMSCCKRCCVVTTIVLVIVVLLLFLIVFVGIPLGFKYSNELRRSFIFPIDDLWPSNPQFSNPKMYNIVGVRNFYVTVNLEENVTLGLWHILPQDLLNETEPNHGDFNYTDLLYQSDYPVILYFHGNAGNRIASVKMYHVLRLYFHVIAFDYRGYGDSSPIIPTEDGLIDDSVRLYKWVQSKTDADIYLWGHSLGTAVSTHAVARLKDDNIIPMGLYLEAPFSNLEDGINSVPLSKVFSWLPWYKATMIDPFKESGIWFETTAHILKVDCPIMIIHAKDDTLLPYTLGEKLFNVAQQNRNLITQGKVTLHLLPEYLECNHMNIYTAPDLPKYIRDHMGVCEAFKKSRD